MRQLSDFRCQRKGRPSISHSGGGDRGGSQLLAAKVKVDFWQADVRIAVSQVSAGLLTSFILLALGPASLFLWQPLGSSAQRSRRVHSGAGGYKACRGWGERRDWRHRAQWACCMRWLWHRGCREAWKKRMMWRGELRETCNLCQRDPKNEMPVRTWPDL